MQFRIADTFTDSLVRLTGDEQKAVKTAAFDLQMNPAHPGLQFHKLGRARDPRFSSVRVSQDVRLIVHRTSASLLLCYVDHHDDAYRWAERRKLETHPKTGAAQLVEVRETVREITVPRYAEAKKEARPKPPLFADILEDDLLAYGVPVEWLEDVRQADDEDTVLELADHLPGEAAEALLELATGGTPHVAQPAGPADDPFEHPDAQHRFQVMNDVEELERALELPRGMVRSDEVLVSIVSRHPGCTWRELLLLLRQEGWPDTSRSELNRRLYRIPTLGWKLGIGNERRWFHDALPAGAATPFEDFEETAGAGWTPPERLHMYPWQKEALAEWEGHGRRGVIEAVMGAGKSRVAIAAAERELRGGGSVVIVVPTVDLLHQWKRELDRVLIDTLEMDAAIGLLGDGYFGSLDHCDVLLSTAASGCRYELLPDNKEGLLIADEVHRYGSESWSRVLEESFDRRLGLTDTYEREDAGSERYLDSYFGGVIFRVDYGRALQDGVIAPFKIAFVAVDFSPHERGVYDEQDRKVRRHKKRLVEEYELPEEPFGEFMREVNLLRSSERGQASLQAGLYLNAFNKRREVLASARAKYSRLEDLTDAVRRAEKSIVFAQTREAAETAVARFTERGVSGAVLTSDMDRMERKQVLAGFEDGTHELVAAPRLLDEGIDVAAADLAVVLATSKSRRQMVQRMGRVLRLKEDNRLARLAVLYVRGTSEDPEFAHEDFLGPVKPVAHDIRYFSADATGRTICDYLNAWTH